MIKTKYLNNPIIISNEKSGEMIRYQLCLQKCKNNSLKICKKMNNLCNIYAVIGNKC